MAKINRTQTNQQSRVERILDDIQLDEVEDQTREIVDNYLPEDIFEDLTVEDEDLFEKLNSEDEKSYDSQTVSGMQKISEEIENYTNVSPKISAEDIDADWQSGADIGEEASLGTSPTPDQDEVDNIAQPWGIGYEPDEEIDIQKKLQNLEQNRKENEGRFEEQIKKI